MAFLRGLARHNNRDWFQPRKAVYEESVKQPMRELVTALNQALAGFAPEYATDPEKAIFRIYRDVRFSKDKKPYKEHIAASFPLRGGMAHGHGGFYVAVSHKEVAVGGGVYMPEPATLLAIRSHIAENHRALRRILANPKVRRLLGEMQGEQLARVPKGFCARSSRGRPAALQAVRPLRGTSTRYRHDAWAVPGDCGSLPRDGAVSAVPERSAAQGKENRRAGFVGVKHGRGAGGWTGQRTQS